MFTDTNNYRVVVEGPVKSVLPRVVPNGLPWFYFQADSPEQAVARFPGSRVERHAYIERPDVPENVGLPSGAFHTVS